MIHKQPLLVRFIFVLLLPILTTGQSYCSSVQNNSSSNLDSHFNNTQSPMRRPNDQSDATIDNDASVILCAIRNANNIAKESGLNPANTHFQNDH